jgi:hypothetical protein
MRARASVVAVATALTVLLVGADTAGACSCAFISPKQQLKQADGAFNGRLLSVEPVEGTTEADFRYRVGVVVKGPFRRGSVVTLRSPNFDSICGLIRTTGKLYGLFVRRDDGRWTGGLCGTVSPRTMRRLADDVDSASDASPQSGGGCASTGHA